MKNNLMLVPAVVIGGLFLCSCNHSDSKQSNSPSSISISSSSASSSLGADDRLWLTDIHFPDPVLASCIASLGRVAVEDLKRLSCRSTTAAQKISRIDGIDQLINLTDLDLSDNDIATIDLSSNVNLKELRLSGNQLIAIDLSSNNDLEYLNLDGNEISAIDISNNTALTSLYLQGNGMAQLDLSANTLLRNLHLNDNDFNSIDLSLNTNIVEFEADNNLISSLDVSANIALNHLSLASNNLSSIDISNNRSLVYLDVSNNEISDIDLTNSSMLSFVDFRGNPVSDTLRDVLSDLAGQGVVRVNVDSVGGDSDNSGADGTDTSVTVGISDLVGVWRGDDGFGSEFVWIFKNDGTYKNLLEFKELSCYGDIGNSGNFEYKDNNIFALNPQVAGFSTSIQLSQDGKYLSTPNDITNTKFHRDQNFKESDITLCVLF